ncbi:MAG: aldehyde dehydrogenase family protein [Blastocatellia bacterium]|nr:aldehyde dehydrogenase family protein [Blastocatellia bacterium]MCX7752499.1 aldehyde dehydrogenase family protein [Blastocatellia bacterium]MDW8167386.1 aldehyde dehydrogenase family protein [Acidobacteriota bacterium]
MTKEYPFIVGGDRRTSAENVEIRNPYDQEVIAIVNLASARDADEAIERAAMAFETTRRLPSYVRSDVLRRVANELTARREEFAELIVLEAGKPIRDARIEVTRAIQTFTVAAEEAKRLGGELLPLDWLAGSENRWAIVRRFPIGPILGITPFNFPLNLVAHKVAPALASGNPIIIKPAPQTPLSALRLGEIVCAAGWPDGGLSVLPCSNEVAGRMLTDERIKKLTFTGSAAVGWMLKAQVPKKKVTLELGGNAAVIIERDADLDFAAKRCVQGGFTYAGQTCISVQRIYVHEAVYEPFLERMLEGVRNLIVGDPRDEKTDVGPMISVAAAERTESWIREAVQAGATVLIGGERHGAFLMPTVLTDVAPEMKVSCEEVFAPVVVVNRYADFDEALRHVNASRYGLQAGIFTRDLHRVFRAYQVIEVGGLIVNDVPTYRADHMPYGGVKDSGMGREGVRSAIEEMTEPRVLVLNLNVS